MRSFPILILLMLLLPLMANDAYASSSGFDDIMDKVRIDNEPLKYDSVTISCMELMDNTGKFSDIDYNYTGWGNWPPADHLERLISMSYSYVLSESPLVNDGILYTKIISGLQLWYNADPHSDNGWWWSIYVPQKLGLLMIVMEVGLEKIPDELQYNLLTRLAERCEDPAKYAGGNQVDIALHMLYRACLTNNEKLLIKSADYAFNSVKYATEYWEDGIRIDNSYQAHGPQFYVGGYGDTQLNAQIPIAYYLKGTKFQLSGKKVAFLSQFIRKSFMNCIRYKTMQYNAHGRCLTRENYISRTEDWYKIFNYWKEVDNTFTSLYDVFLENIKVGQKVLDCNISNTYYYCSDFMLHVRPKWTFSVRFSSERTIRCESGNGENIKGYFLSDGSTCLQETGNEYTNIMPLWDWTLLPGTSTPQIANPPLPQKDWVWDFGTADFAGGVSDSICGIAAYSYNDDRDSINIGANKGWFCFDNAVVCLGSKVHSSNNIVRTSVEQSWGKSSFVITGSSGVQQDTNRVSSDGIKMVCHENTAYYFLDDNNVVAEVDSVTGNWHDINTNQKDEMLRGRVFKLYEEIKGSSYAYIIMPNISVNKAPKYNELNYEVLVNNDTLQVVCDKQKNICGMIFYSPCCFCWGPIDIQALQPCIVLAKLLANNTILFHIADPTQKNLQMSLGVRTKGADKYDILSCEYENPDIDKGRSLVMNYNLNNATGIENPQHDLDNYSGAVLLYRINGSLEGKHNMIKGKIADSFVNPGCYIVKSCDKNERNKIYYKMIMK